MLKLIYPEDMRACEERYFSSGAARSIDIMENAARALADAVCEQLPEGSSVRFACGTGGNGGDGTACARLLGDRYRCELVLSGAPKTPDAIENLRRARECGIPEYEPAEAAALPRPDCWVDALLGTGFTGEPRGETARLIERIREDHDRGSLVVAADIPSGLNGRTGVASATCVCADRTVTFGLRKPGQLLGDGLDLCGELRCADVGFPPTAFDVCAAELAEPSDCRLPIRPRSIYKNRCGHLLIVAGSVGMAGAALMCTRAALRCGVGLVTVACPAELVPILQLGAPQAMCLSLPSSGGAISVSAAEPLRSAAAGKTAAVIGCGLSRNAAPQAVRAVLEAAIPAVVDADALNLISEYPELAQTLHAGCVLTPHPGEAARLLRALDRDPALLSDPIAAAQALADTGAVTLLKGATSVISGPEGTYLSASGCAGMARGGSGDVLSGVLGALLADPARHSLTLTATIASELHGLAGELARRRYGERSMNACDLIDALPEVLSCATSR